ncbi:hypothetical protein HanPI659440_Chr10g0380681 [Helianthus annuus]|nr:hypothetical protein HanPI659440_Chr10g0380681 [Helianthus annuus]
MCVHTSSHYLHTLQFHIYIHTYIHTSHIHLFVNGALPTNISTQINAIANKHNRLTSNKHDEHSINMINISVR